MATGTATRGTESSLRTPDLMATFAEMADFDEAAGERLRTAREKLNLSQFEAAHRLGVSDKTLGKWERAQATPRASNWRKIEEVYDVTVEEIRGEPEPAQLDRIERMLEQLLAAMAGGEGGLPPLPESLQRSPKGSPRGGQDREQRATSPGRKTGKPKRPRRASS